MHEERSPSIKELQKIQSEMRIYLHNRNIEYHGLSAAFRDSKIIVVIFLPTFSDSIPKTITWCFPDEKTYNVHISQNIMEEIIAYKNT